MNLEAPRRLLVEPAGEITQEFLGATQCANVAAAQCYVRAPIVRCSRSTTIASRSFLAHTIISWR